LPMDSGGMRPGSLLEVGVRFLITLDGSELSETVLDTIRELAKASRAEVHLLTVGDVPHGAGRGKREKTDVLVKLPLMGSFPFDSPRAGYFPRVENVPVETREQYIARKEHELDGYLLDLAAQFPGLPVKRAVSLSDSPAEVIIEYAREHHIDLIAMATHGRSGLSRAVQGSVATEVMQSGAAPVLMVRPSSDAVRH
jgi:nucleotide-binding universal stress UspA family protein